MNLPFHNHECHEGSHEGHEAMTLLMARIDPMRFVTFV